MIDSTARSSYVDFRRLLSAPHVTLQLVAACQVSSGASEELLDIVLQDSGLCVRILSTAVRLCPDILDPAAPVSSALTGLGRSAVRSLVLQAGKTLIDTPIARSHVQFLRKLWFYSQVTGTLCRSLADAVGYRSGEEAHLCGLLLNLGMLSLFSCDPQAYTEQIGSAFGSPYVRGKEQASFSTDNCLVATTMVDVWRIDSFIPEAIRFIYLDPPDCREGALLVRIARVAFELCKTPFELSVDGEKIAAQLLDLDPVGLKSAFHRATERYRLLAPIDKSQDECYEELERTRRRLTSLVFSFAEQEGIRSEMAAISDPDSMVDAARSLYLRVSPAREVIFFVPGPDGEQFVGLPASGQSRRIAELMTPVAGANLMAEALRSAAIRHSFEINTAAISVFDQQLLGLCGSSGVAVLPLRNGKKWQGAVVLGLESEKDVASLNDPICYQLGRAVATAFTSMTSRGRVSETSPQADVLVRKIAHEIRTPLAVVNNYLTAFIPLFEGHENAGVIGDIEKEVRRIDDILTYYTESDRTSVVAERSTPHAPDSLALSAVGSLSETCFKNREIKIVTDFDSRIAPLPVSATAVRQILINLLKNAAEAITEDGRIILATSECLTSSGESQVLISVDDNGPGIDEEMLAELFNPVASTKGEGHAGLGLHIVKELADDIGARIVCQSRPGQGTRFELRIPRPADH
ncbi:MAG TPA: ATP-binding protein [Desulfuromonadales bacterium]|nr:ATP-binding protein [Desulfuromonadales bacterium]